MLSRATLDLTVPFTKRTRPSKAGALSMTLNLRDLAGNLIRPILAWSPTLRSGRQTYIILSSLRKQRGTLSYR